MTSTDQKKSRGGRPPSENPKTCKLEVRLTPQEKAAIRQIAESHGHTMSSFLVTLALGAQARPIS
jgi:uncharacterized protein (DUF1778 family)